MRILHSWALVMILLVMTGCVSVKPRLPIDNEPASIQKTVCEEFPWHFGCIQKPIEV